MLLFHRNLLRLCKQEFFIRPIRFVIENCAVVLVVAVRHGLCPTIRKMFVVYITHQLRSGDVFRIAGLVVYLKRIQTLNKQLLIQEMNPTT
ncbi:MAG: hypothetical protein COA78_13265 [Blastopirellula sp.]|nr:MAG: hypothetical protein COA78_13265 [Blastopirellula sp.]